MFLTNLDHAFNYFYEISCVDNVVQCLLHFITKRITDNFKVLPLCEYKLVLNYD